MTQRKNLYKRDWGGFLKAVLLNPTAICIIAFLLIVGVMTALEFTHESTLTAKVVSINAQQHTQGNKNGFTTTYHYLVATDQGTLEISPDGLMASPCFGTLHEGNIYTMHLRGFSVPLIGLYPYIIEAKEIK